MSALHPSSFLPNEILFTVRQYAADAEEQCQLHDKQLKMIYKQRWFKMFVPKNYGGLAYTLPEVLKTEEALAWADGSTGWVVTLCSGAGWFVGFLNPDLSKKIFSNNDVCIAGSGAPTGTAEIRKDGYIINGSWKYATGALHASMFTANCVITNEGIPLLNHDGGPQIRSFIFENNEVQLRKNWNSMGLIATASHGFTINNKFVPLHRAFEINNTHFALDASVYQYPFMQLAETTLVVNISGMAQRFLDLCMPLFKERMARKPAPKKDLMNLLEVSSKSLQRCRDEFYEAVEKSWSSCERGEPIPEIECAEVRNTSYQLYLTSMHIVNELYPNAGLAAADMSTEINRVWRNIHTASQHTLFTLR